MKVKTQGLLWFLFTIVSQAAAQPTATCQALQSLASNSIAQFRCSTNAVCNGIECDATLIQGVGDYHTEVVVLPCEQPLPAISIVFSEPNGNVALIATLNRSASIPLTSAAFTSTVMLTVDQLMGAIGFQVRSSFPGFGAVTVFSYTVIPIDTSTCSNTTDCIPSSVIALSPRYGNMLGGEAILVSGPCFDETDNITCVFGDSATAGMFFNEQQALCVSPILSQTGRVPFQIIVSGVNEFRGNSVFYSVSFTTAHEVEIVSDSLLLEPGANVNIRWTPESILPMFAPDDYTVDITLHTMDPVTGIWREVDTLVSDISNNGAVDVTIPDIRDTIVSSNADSSRPPDPACPAAVQVSVSASTVQRGTIAILLRLIRSPIAKWSFVAYLVFELAGSAYCAWWNSQQPEGIGQEILDRVSPCPCTEDAAGRQNSGFNRDNPITQRIFHPGSSSCFREVVKDSTSTGGSGNQCCYDDNGDLIPPGRRGAGTVDLISPELDTFGHFWVDVLPAIACCWTVFADCSSYTRHRPVGDCSDYQPPPPACVFGDPHTVTLDGHMYTFNGKGEFVLIETVDSRFTLQGRMVAATDMSQNAVPATVFSAIVGREDNSDTVQFELSNASQINTLVNGELVDFEGLPEQDFNNVTVADLGSNAFSATFLSGAYLDVKVQNGILSIVIVSLPTRFQGTTRGLMGSFNGDTSDDLIPKDSTQPIPLNSSLQTIHESFGITWIIDDPADSLFTYRPNEEWATFYDPDFVPLYEPQFTDANLQMEALEACGDDNFCLFDIAATERMEVGLSTLAASQELEEIIQVSLPVVCDPPCENGACISNDTCSCATGFIGDLCTEAVLTECDQVRNPCGNGGNCTQNGSAVLCECTSDFTGTFCEQEIPLQISFINNSPRVVGSSISVNMSTSKPTSSFTCYLRDARREFFSVQNCSLLNTVYPNLNTGYYVLRIVATTDFGEVATLRRAIRVGSNIDCTVNLINSGVEVQEGVVSIQFVVNGDASFQRHLCQVDREPRQQCFSEIPVVLTELSSGDHRFRVFPQDCIGLSHRLSVRITVP